MKMSFYQELQLNQGASKEVIRQAESVKEKAYHIGVYIFKILITMLFCVAFVTAYSKIFGSDNSIVGVVTLLCLLSFRFTNTALKTSHGIAAMVMIFIILAVGPRLANSGGLEMQLLVNLISILLITILGCRNVMFFNHSTLVLGYLLLFGYDVTGEAYNMRLWAILAGAVMTIVVYYRNHRDKHYDSTLIDLIKEFSLQSSRTKWQISITVGISLLMFIAGVLGFPRTMWIGIAAMSVIQPVQANLGQRVKERIWGNLVGSIVFVVLCGLVPEPLRFTFGIIGGIGVGLSASYGWQAVFNSLGAMTIAIGFLGVKGAMFFRIFNNVCGSVFGYLFHCIASKILQFCEDSETFAIE